MDLALNNLQRLIWFKTQTTIQFRFKNFRSSLKICSRLMTSFSFSFQLALNLSELFSFFHSSLLHIQSDLLLYDVNEVVRDELQTLVGLGLVVQKRKGTDSEKSPPSKEKDNSDLTLEITKLGKATYKGAKLSAFLIAILLIYLLFIFTNPSARAGYNTRSIF